MAPSAVRLPSPLRSVKRIGEGGWKNLDRLNSANISGLNRLASSGAVVALPMLFMGSLITESFFGIPGLGSYTIDAIQAQDFAIVRAMVFMGSVLYIAGLLLTDISYTLVDPRIRLE